MMEVTKIKKNERDAVRIAVRERPVMLTDQHVDSYVNESVKNVITM